MLSFELTDELSASEPNLKMRSKRLWRHQHQIVQQQNSPLLIHNEKRRRKHLYSSESIQPLRGLLFYLMSSVKRLNGTNPRFILKVSVLFLQDLAWRTSELMPGREYTDAVNK